MAQRKPIISEEASEQPSRRTQDRQSKAGQTIGRPRDDRASLSPFAAGCGADISGVDIREPLSDHRPRCDPQGLARQPRIALSRRADDRRAAYGVYPPVRRAGVQPGRADRQAIRRQRRRPMAARARSRRKFRRSRTLSRTARRSVVSATARRSGTPTARLSMSRQPPACCASLECPPPSAGGSTSFLNCYSALMTISPPRGNQNDIDGLIDDPRRDPFIGRQGA